MVGILQQMACGPKKETLDAIAKVERPVFMGLSARGALIQLWFSADKQTYTVVMFPPQGDLACLMDLGTDGQFDVPKPGAPT